MSTRLAVDAAERVVAGDGRDALGHVETGCVGVRDEGAVGSQAFAGGSGPGRRGVPGVRVVGPVTN
ncbi:hypothetical protein QNO09_16835 [Streptomyces sp. 378]|uniref:hypothetical protein n=1 Tax=Streptomyces sp. 378 TaxID=3049412 RepID=UPI0024C2E88C|nr:hypothetical protein [Streptomyces sp. 378]MDK1344938.1 hypothetical protein [Streptomyces sp. 378]